MSKEEMNSYVPELAMENYRIFPAIRRGVCPYRMTPNN